MSTPGAVGMTAGMRTRRASRAVPVVCAAAAALVAAAAPAAPLSEAQQRRVTPIVALVKDNIDAVVNISATHVVTSQGDAFFDVPRQMKSNSVGSGAVIHASGYVLTNAHVVARASELSVLLHDGRRLPATVVAQLPDDDVAIIKVDLPPGARLPAVALGRSDDLLVGETVVAIGNPVGLQHSVTTGIISAVGRTFAAQAGARFDDIIQTDAAINPGNSGGPLFNILGEQVGVNTAIRSDAQNVGFAIPIDRVKSLLPRLLAVEAQGRVRLGMALGAEARGDKKGVTVGAVESKSPAARAGLAQGMVLESIGGRPTPTLIEALVALREQKVGRAFPVRAILPEGTTDELQVTIEQLPKPDGAKLAAQRFGASLRAMDREAAAKLGLRAGSGLLVDDVEKKSPAAAVGIQRGDLVVRVGPYGVQTLDDLGVLLEQVPAGARVPLRIVRITKSAAFQSEVVLTAR